MPKHSSEVTGCGNAATPEVARRRFRRLDWARPALIAGIIAVLAACASRPPPPNGRDFSFVYEAESEAHYESARGLTQRGRGHPITYETIPICTRWLTSQEERALIEQVDASGVFDEPQSTAEFERCDFSVPSHEVLRISIDGQERKLEADFCNSPKRHKPLWDALMSVARAKIDRCK